MPGLPMRTTAKSVDGSLDEVNSLLNRAEVFLLGIRDFNAESVLESEGHFNGGQAVGAEVFDEGGFVLDVLFLDAKLFGDDLLDLLFDFVHF